MRKNIFQWLLVSVLLCAAIPARAELSSATRFDFQLPSLSIGLRGEMKRTVNDYRIAVNQTGITPSADRQLRAETERLQQLLRSRGYYRAQVSGQFNDSKGRPVYDIEPGQLTLIRSLKLQGELQPDTGEWQSLQVGDPLAAVDVLAEQSRLKTAVEQSNCFYRVSVSHQVELSADGAGADLTFSVSAQDAALFGSVQFSGVSNLDPQFLRRVTGIQAGQCYSRQVVDDAVISLFDLGLFSSVRPSSEFNNGSVGVTFDVQMRKARTLSAGLGWQTELGWGVKAGWQHRNLLGQAQSLTLNGSWQVGLRALSAGLQVPSFFDRRNHLNWLNSVEHAYGELETLRYTSTARIERRASLDDYFEFGLSASQLNERGLSSDEWQRYRQIRVPLQYRFDSVRDPFNPGRGSRILLDIEPVWDIDEAFTPFVLTEIGLHNFVSNGSPTTLASRIRWGSLWYGEELGSTLDNIPDSEWLTAGGSATLRGYGYRSVGLDPDVEAGRAGATQRWLITQELRTELNESWGLVAFWDAGAIGQNINPLDQEQWLNGAGLGVRFFTRFAPLRVDLAFPLNQREQDADYLVYVSLGQAF